MIAYTFALACVATVAVPMPARSESLDPLIGLWVLVSAPKTICKDQLDGKLDDLSSAEASNYGLMEISSEGIDWVWSVASCQIDSVSGGPSRYKARAECVFKTESHDGAVEFELKSPDRMSVRFDAQEFPGSGDYRRCPLR
jgi:hypothetical protein